MDFQKKTWATGEVIEADALNRLEDGVDSAKVELTEVPHFQTFTAGASSKERKTIQLANADTISGIMTDGSGVNLAMVSEWDKADFGSSQLPFNINSKDGIVTVNDKDELVFKSEVETLVSEIEALKARVEALETA